LWKKVSFTVVHQLFDMPGNDPDQPDLDRHVLDANPDLDPTK
jgi:hypothetical protein